VGNSGWARPGRIIKDETSGRLVGGAGGGDERRGTMPRKGPNKEEIRDKVDPQKCLQGGRGKTLKIRTAHGPDSRRD